MYKLNRILILFLFIGTVLFPIENQECEGLDLKSAKMYNADVTNASSKSIHLKDYTKTGNPLIFAFVAEWCAPCQQELDSLNILLPELESLGIKVIAIALDSKGNEEKINKRIAEKNWKMTFLFDQKDEAKTIYHIQTLPYLMVTDKHGKIAYKSNGFSEKKYNFLKLVINEVK